MWTQHGTYEALATHTTNCQTEFTIDRMNRIPKAAHGQYRERQTTVMSSTLIPYYDVSKNVKGHAKLLICLFAVFWSKEFCGVGHN